MLDQNTTTVLLALITVGGTLGGVILGTILSYRLSLRQENRRKKKEVTEELYVLVLKVRAEIDMHLALGSLLDFPSVVSNSLLRIVALTDIYFKSLTARVTEFSGIVNNLQNANRSQYNVPDGYGHLAKGNTDEFNQAKEAYTKSYTKLMETLQELGR